MWFLTMICTAMPFKLSRFFMTFHVLLMCRASPTKIYLLIKNFLSSSDILSHNKKFVVCPQKNTCVCVRQQLAMESNMLGNNSL